MSNNNVWTKCDSDVWVTEASDLQANGNPPLPGTNIKFDFKRCHARRDTEGEIQSWTLTLNDGTRMEVFND